jgi:hypothetical protein
MPNESEIDAVSPRCKVGSEGHPRTGSTPSKRYPNKWTKTCVPCTLAQEMPYLVLELQVLSSDKQLSCTTKLYRSSNHHLSVY